MLQYLGSQEALVGEMLQQNSQAHPWKDRQKTQVEEEQEKVVGEQEYPRDMSSAQQEER